jgi:hypothetical protein
MTAVRWLRTWAALASLAGGMAQAAEPALRVEVQARQPVLVGQQVQIDVTVVAPNYFTSAPPFPTLAVPGAIVTMPDERGQNAVEQAGGETLATITKSYQFAAQQPGDFELPPAAIEFGYAGDDGKPRSARLSLPPTRITARRPEGATGSAGVLPVARLTIRQSLDRSSEGLKVGDALVRSIEIRADRTQAMLIPPPRFEAPEGVRVFVADPVLSDASAGGGFVGGRRTDRATYVFEKAGRYTLPAIEVKWFDSATQRPATAQAPAIRVQIGAALSRGQGIAPDAAVLADAGAPRGALHWRPLAALVLALALLAAVFWWARARWPRWQKRRRVHQAALAHSDAVMFERVLAASRSGDARQAHAALLAWCTAHAGTPPRDWAAQLQDAGLASQIDALERQLFGRGGAPAGGWSGADFATALRAAHRQWHAARPAVAGHHAQRFALGPLNPIPRRKDA